MDPAQSENTTVETERPSTTNPELLSFDEWNNIHRAIVEEDIEPGREIFKYRDRTVPLYWEPRPWVPYISAFSTAEEARKFLSRTRGCTAVEAGPRAQSIMQSNVPPCNVDNHSPADASSKVESASSNIRIDPAQEHSIKQSSCITADLDLAVHKLELSINNVTDELDELSLQKSAEEENVPEDNDGQPLVTEDSPPQESVPSNTSTTFTVLFSRLEESLKEWHESEKRKLKEHFHFMRTFINNEQPWSEESLKKSQETREEQMEEEYQSLLTLMRTLKIQKPPEAQSSIQHGTNSVTGVATGWATAKGRSDTEVTVSASDGNIMRQEASEVTAAEKTSRQEEAIDVNWLRDLRGGASVLCTPFPKNPSDQEDWVDIEVAMIRENAPNFPKSFLFRGRCVHLNWNCERIHTLKEDYHRQVMLENRNQVAQMNRDQSTAEASPCTHDAVEDVKKEDVECACGDSPKKNKKGKVKGKKFANPKRRR